MGFLSKLNQNETTSVTEENTILEEQYEKIFSKIARDFLTKEDFKDIMIALLQRISLTNPSLANSLISDPIVLSFEDNAIKKSQEYKENVRKPIHKRRKYKDII